MSDTAPATTTKAPVVQPADVPEGCIIVGGAVRPSRYATNPRPYPYNLADRKASGMFTFMDLLTECVGTKGQNLWLDLAEIKSMITDGKAPNLTESRALSLISEFSSGKFHRFGWYLLEQSATKKVHLMYRDPMVHYVNEYSATLTPEQKVADETAIKEFGDKGPSYEAAPAVAKGPRKARTPKAAEGGTQPAATTAAPVVSGKFLERVSAAGMQAELDHLISTFCEAAWPTSETNRTDTPVATVLAVMDVHGFSGAGSINNLSPIQRAGGIKPGFFKHLSEFDKAFQAKSVTVAV